MKLNVGDRVIFDFYNGNHEGTRGLLTWLGILIHDNKDNSYHVMYYDDYKINVAYSVDYHYMIPIEEVESERERIKIKYDSLIKAEKNRLKTVSQEEKDKQKVERYESIKQRIIRNCEWCISKDLDDEDFVNRVKEIANLKKQLFAPEKLPILSEIHRYNGTIKYNIRKLEEERDRALTRISDKEIEKRYGKFK